MIPKKLGDGQWFGWSDLHRIGRGFAFRSSYFWLVTVPIAAKLLDELPPSVKFNLPGADEAIELVFELPFTWVMFYFSAILMSFGRFTTGRTCPRIIQEHLNYSDFLGAGKGDRHLTGYAYQVGVAIQNQSQQEQAPSDTDRRQNIYWEIREKAESHCLWARILTSCCFGLGGLLLLKVLFESFLTVIDIVYL